ncbi:hypothetical protein SAMD00019534_022420, partial [Acytostelium subglobosum LB1]|uniref:hypothetical protein n=1 Tax=Acytostelium subglobosum LB1 TaxID=1410327 RepID=UPI0006448AF9
DILDKDDKEHKRLDGACLAMTCKYMYWIWYKCTLLSMSTPPQHLLQAHGNNQVNDHNRKTILSLIIGADHDDYAHEDDVQLLPSTLQTLTYGRKYDKVIYPGSLPDSLISLTLSKKYNHPLVAGLLPLALQTLVFGSHFNQIIEVGILPRSLKKLSFGKRFNQLLNPGTLPALLEHLVFEGQYGQPFEKDTLPQTLRTLTLMKDYNLALNKANLPASLTALETVDIFDPASLQASITTLGLGGVPPQHTFPNAITKLVLGEISEDEDDDPNILVPDRLPDTITSLYLNSWFRQPMAVGYLPNSITHLSNYWNRDNPLQTGTLPSKLTELMFNSEFNQSIEPGVLPDSITKLQFGDYFDKCLMPGSLPPLLRWLDIGYSYNQKLVAGTLPPSLTQLKLSKALKGGTDVVLPNSIKHLDLDYNRHIGFIDTLANSIEDVGFCFLWIYDLAIQHGLPGPCSVAVNVLNAFVMGNFPSIGNRTMHSFQTLSRLFPNVQTFNILINDDMSEPAVFKRIDSTTI